MAAGQNILCDGCGQSASAEHLAARFRRLEWSTRYRPLHVNTLVLGAVVPSADSEFVYSGAVPFSGEAAGLLQVAGISAESKTADTIHHEFQRAGFFVVHLLDCPVKGAVAGSAEVSALLARRLPTTFARIRKSIKPKRLVLLGAQLDPFVEKFQAEVLGCALLLDGGKSFKLPEGDEAVERLRSVLSLPTAVAR
jgi:hypothetical protein